jgi:hypothetical protein
MSDEVQKETAVTMVCLYESFASTSSGDRRPKCRVSDDLPTAFPGGLVLCGWRKSGEVSRLIEGNDME